MSLIDINPLMDFDPSLPLRVPGEVLLNDYLRPRAIPLARLARRTGISVTTLRQITLGRRRISAEFAMRLANVTDPTPAYWLVLQARHDLAVASGAGPEGAWSVAANAPARLEPPAAT